MRAGLASEQEFFLPQLLEAPNSWGANGPPFSESLQVNFACLEQAVCEPMQLPKNKLRKVTHN